MAVNGHGAERKVVFRAGERLLGRVLIGGVLLAAVLVIAGGGFYLLQHGAARPDYVRFNPESGAAFHSLSGTLSELAHGRSRAIIQLGLFVLVLLQSARVALCMWIFGRVREWPYLLMSLFLLAVLLHSFV